MSGNANGNGNAAATLSDDLVARAKAIASRSDDLLHLLEDARLRLVDAGEKPATQRRFKSKPSPKKGAAGKPGKPGIPEGLRLLTTQMSVAGADRDEIAERLRDEFGVENPEPILKNMGL
jgi:CHASE1-domain containing sensor protein